jgi:hypothetical protein
MAILVRYYCTMSKRKAAGTTRTVRFPFRMNEEDASLLRSVSRAHGLDAAALLRMLVREERRRLDALVPRPGSEHAGGGHS